MTNDLANHLNKLSESEVDSVFEKCCAARRWVVAMTFARPFKTDTEVITTASVLWHKQTKQSILEAFAAHPKIGDVESLQEKYANTSDWAAGEQAGATSANEETISNLAAANDRYFEKFGYIFIVCATGKSAQQMLEILESRLPNDPEAELKIASQEQLKITLLRLKKLANVNS